MSGRLTHLMARWLEGTATKEERKELWGLSLEAANQEQLSTELEGAWSGVTDEQSMSAGKVDELFEKIGSVRVEDMDAEPVEEAVVGRQRPFRRRLLWSTAAAAVVIF